MLNPIIDKYTSTRARTVEICEPLKTEDYIPQPVAFASPAKWHIAHTTWFFEEFVLAEHLPGYQRFHPDFAFLFNSYYHSVGQRTLRAERGNLTRPTVDEVYAYRDHVDAHICSYLKQDISAEVKKILVLGLNHEQQHQELLITDIKYILGHNPTFPVYAAGASLVNNRNNGQAWLKIPADIYEVGFEGDGFCFDNELARHKVYLQEFEICQSLVTNGDFIDFINDGAYQDFSLWLDEAWAWIQAENIRSPMYWHLVDDEWFQFTLGGLQKIDPDEILCHVSYFEAAAYAEWAGKRLPTEFEWEAASAQLNRGKRWEWTNSAYLAYPNFRKAAGAIGEYNGKFMINQMVLRGSSVATSPGHSRDSYRNFFHPHHQWQFSGIRLAK